MWLMVLKGIGFKLFGLLRHPVTWIVLLSITTAFCANGWKSQIATTRQVRVECQSQAEAALRASLQEQANAWQTVYEAQREAIVRQATAEAVAAAAARHWRQKYDQALKTPACMKWASEVVACPTS